MTVETDWARRQREARERWIDVAGKGYKIRRPTQLDMRRLFASGRDVGETLALEFVVDWRGVTQADLQPAVGGEDAVPFSTAAYQEWISDRLEDLRQIADAVWEAFKARQAEVGAIEGKSPSS